MEYSLENIRNYRQKQKIELNKINVFIGENSSGKSTALRIIPLLQQSIGNEGNRIEWYGENVDFGMENNLKNQVHKQIKIGFNLNEREVKRNFNLYIGRYNNLLMENKIKLDDIITNFELIISNDRIEKLILNDKDYKIAIQFNNHNNIVKIGRYSLNIKEINSRLGNDYLIGTYEILKKTESSSEDYIKTINELNKVIINVNTISRCLTSLLMNTTYIGPYRDYGERYKRLKYKKVKKLDSNAENLIAYLKSFTKLQLNELNKFLEQNFLFSIDEKSLYSNEITSLMLNIDGKLRNIVDLGSGYSQILPIVIKIFEATKSRRHETNIVIIEQPELHLHPKLQRQFSRIIFELVKKANNIYIIMETHSTEMLYELSDMENMHNTNILNIYNCEKNEEGSILTKYVVTDDGSISWPKNFLM